MDNTELLQAIRMEFVPIFQEIRSDIAEIKTDVAVLKTDVAVLKTDVAELKTDVAVLKTDVAVLKTDVASLDKRMGNMEVRMDSMEVRMDRAENDIHDVKILMEHDIPTTLKLLAEGHAGILERLPQNEQVAEVRTRVSTLEQVVTIHTQEIYDLKKAN